MKLEKNIPGSRETCLLYTSDAADERSSVDLGGRRIIKKKKTEEHRNNDIQKKKNKINRNYEIIQQRVMSRQRQLSSPI